MSRKTRKKEQYPRIHELLQFDRDITCGDNCGASQRKRAETIPPRQLGLFAGQIENVIGVDEVGRGCLAGPVVAAAVMLPELTSSARERLSRLDDSKKLTAAEREELACIIKEVACYSICEASAEEIDEINILQASLLAMKRAVQELLCRSSVSLSGTILLVDGNKTLKIAGARQMTVIKGDSRSASIAAASVIAKVYRDSLMVGLADSYPDYMWQSNKGYPSPVHRQAIKERGMTPWHRRSFRCVVE